MDALSEILKATRWSARTYFGGAEGDPWCMQMHYRPQGVFHAVLRGRCYLREGANPDPVVLDQGDVIAFPTGASHVLSGTPEGLTLTPDEVIKVTGDDEVMVFKQGAVSFLSHEPGKDSTSGTQWLSGTMSYDTSIRHPLLKELPCQILVGKGQEVARQGVQSLVNVLANESKANTAGSRLAIDRLTEVLFLQLVRCHLQQSGLPDGYFAALTDPQIGVALNLVHSSDDGTLTVESLCEAAAMSRTSFNTRFTKMVGETPKAYLTNTRLLLAKTKLQFSHAPLCEIAEAAGYSSDSSFSKAIKKHFDMTPGELRKSSP